MKRTTCKIFSDASYDHMTGKCGYGVAIVMKDLCIFKYGSIRGAKSSCEAEVLAAKKGLDYLKTKEFNRLCRQVKKVVFLSDNHCVRAIGNESSTIEKWERSPKKDKHRLAEIARKMRASVDGYEHGVKVIHITGHTKPENTDESEKRKTEYKYNNWCDQSARKNLRYDLKGKMVIKCAGIADPENYAVEVPIGAKSLWQQDKMARNLQ